MYFLFQLRVQRNDMTMQDHMGNNAMQGEINNRKRNMKNAIRINAKFVLNAKVQEGESVNSYL